MADIDDVLTGITLVIDHCSDWLSLWKFDPLEQSIDSVYTSRRLEAVASYRECKAVLEKELLDILKQSDGNSFSQSGDNVDKCIGDVYVASAKRIEASDYYLVKYERVPFPFQMEHRARSKRVSDLEKQILRNIVHELLTPINSIEGLNGELGEAMLDPHSKVLLDLHTQSCHQLKTHIADMVDSIGLRNSEARSYTKQDFNLFETLFSVTSKANRSILEQHRKLKFTLDCPSQQASLPVRGYPHLLEQLLLHLIDNAIRFTQDGGDICLSVELKSRSVLAFSVLDSGCGVDSDLSRLIFCPFILGDMADTRTKKGLGLGLSSALSCLIIMSSNENARIQLESSPGAGARFHFDLPYERSKVTVFEQPDSLKLPHPVGSYRILVAEDNPTQQMIISRLIDKLGFDYLLVANGIEAVGEFIRGDSHYDVILMDIQMPGISGHEATKIIRKHEQEFNLAKTPIVAITANIENEVHSESISVGMDGHYGKPVNRVVLDELIRKSLLGIPV